MGALHVAAQHGNEQTVIFLLEEGANPALKNSAGHTALQVAQMANKGHTHMGCIRALAGAAAQGSAAEGSSDDEGRSHLRLGGLLSSAWRHFHSKQLPRKTERNPVR